MLDLGPVTEDEMVLAFVRGEIDSPLYGFRAGLGPHAGRIVDHADLADAEGNTARKEVLRQGRGYPDRLLFQGLPRNVTWRRFRLDPNEVADLRYANHPAWVALSGGTRRVRDGAANVGSSVPAAAQVIPNIK